MRPEPGQPLSAEPNRSSPAPGPVLEIVGLTDVGRLRERNEDAIDWDAALGVAMLADGMGDPNFDSDIGRITYAFRQWRGEPAPDWWNEAEHGAWEYHEHLIAEAEEKPLRVFLQVGENDFNWNGVDQLHDWVEANQAMAKVLKDKTYHYRFLYSLGAAHVDPNVIAQTLPETLVWLWQGFPIP